MRGKYKSFYISAFAIFFAINIIAIFYVFKDYRCETKATQQVTSTKLRYSKVKEKIEEIETKLNSDSSYTDQFSSIHLDKQYLDSILNHDKIDHIVLTQINEKIYNLSSKSDILEQELSSKQN